MHLSVTRALFCFSLPLLTTYATRLTDLDLRISSQINDVLMSPIIFRRDFCFRSDSQFSLSLAHEHVCILDIALNVECTSEDAKNTITIIPLSAMFRWLQWLLVCVFLLGNGTICFQLCLLWWTKLNEPSYFTHRCWRRSRRFGNVLGGCPPWATGAERWYCQWRQKRDWQRAKYGMRLTLS